MALYAGVKSLGNFCLLLLVCTEVIRFVMSKYSFFYSMSVHCFHVLESRCDQREYFMESAGVRYLRTSC